MLPTEGRSLQGRTRPPESPVQSARSHGCNKILFFKIVTSGLEIFQAFNFQNFSGGITLKSPTVGTKNMNSDVVDEDILHRIWVGMEIVWSGRIVTVSYISFEILPAADTL